MDTFMWLDFQTNQNIAIVEKTIGDLTKAMNDKLPSRALALKRLENRTGRQGVENCRDETEVQLHHEVMQLDIEVQNLRNMIGELITCVRRLKQVAVRTDIQLEMKNNTLHIDAVQCSDLRKRINYQTY